MIIILMIIIIMIIIIMMKVLLQGTEGVGGLAWASIDDTCRLNYNVRMEVPIPISIPNTGRGRCFYTRVSLTRVCWLQGADMSTATSSLELEDYPVQNLKVVKSLDDGGYDDNLFNILSNVILTVMLLAS